MSIDIIKTVSILIIFILAIFTILLFHIGRHTKSNIYLAYYFISQIAVAICYLIPAESLAQILLTSVCYSWGQFYFLFIISLINPDFRFRSVSLLHFLPVLIALYLLIGRQYNIYINTSNQALAWISRNYNNLLSILFNTLILGYSMAIIIYYLIRHSKIKAIKTSNIWINFAVFGFLISSGIVQIINILDTQPQYKFIFGNALFLVFFSILFYIAIISRVISDKIYTIEKYRKPSLNNTISRELLVQLEAYMEEHKAYLNPELSLRNLAGELKIQEKYISEVINRLKGMNFSEFVNFYRISHAMEMLKNPEYQDKTMLFILFESGFNSKTTFNTRFKQIVGCTPLEYKQSLEN